MKNCYEHAQKMEQQYNIFSIFFFNWKVITNSEIHSYRRYWKKNRKNQNEVISIFETWNGFDIIFISYIKPIEILIPIELSDYILCKIFFFLIFTHLIVLFFKVILPPIVSVCVVAHIPLSLMDCYFSLIFHLFGKAERVKSIEQTKATSNFTTYASVHSFIQHAEEVLGWNCAQCRWWSDQLFFSYRLTIRQISWAKE